ncbi:TRAP-type C4-dicarboxylate transport system permease small subunit [Constrictibacter sp. MBR-5]|jgi:TRAP-type C4-dicarboxylate transport system permease small subunit|uniref:TRAP transporter small permease subunit n=1 Tax=Constrictibacter sp. MBR-5 TaxID=3156467 RepID=UPI0033952DD5
MKSVTNAIGVLFGLMLVGLAFLVATETVTRKLFNFSFQGADELGGYTLAIGSALAFSVALVGRAHIRIDLVHMRLPAAVQAVLNWAAAMLLAAFGLLLVYVCWTVVADTMEYNSTAATPWATPLVYPQGAWYAALAAFALLAVAMALRATVLLLRGRIAAVNREFGPHTVEDELREELDDLKQR